LDGIADPDDKCPNEYGTKENNGCPLVVKKDVVSANLEAEEQEILKKAFENLTFETGKSNISNQSKIGLDSLALILIEKPAYYLQVSGHTDNEGAAAKNQALSLSRATEVKNYLVAKGVSASRIVAKGFGSSIPVAPNNSAENKRKNRRVELKVYKP
jgi:outer membrane protein OmpA-like peptidoglycan-associated protein